MNHFQGNIFQELKEKKVLDKDGKVDALGAYGKMKLTGQEIAQYFKKNKVKDATVKKAVEVALDLSGADSIARKEIAKYYGNAILKNKDVQKALQYANESYISNQEVESLDESLLVEKNLMPEIQKIVSDKSAAKVGGVMLDMFTASMISKVYDKVNDGNKKKMESANITVLVKLAHKVMGMKEEVTEAKSSTGYDLYHKTFSGAMQHAYAYSKKKFGIEIDPKEIDDKVAMGPKRPSSGKTNSYRLKGKDGKKGIQVQVANLDNKRYELNMYKEETSNMDRYASAIRES